MNKQDQEIIKFSLSHIHYLISMYQDRERLLSFEEHNTISAVRYYIRIIYKSLERTRHYHDEAVDIYQFFMKALPHEYITKILHSEALEPIRNRARKAWEKHTFRSHCFEVKDIVCDYGIFENGELLFVFNSKTNALRVKEILEFDKNEGAELE